MSDGVRTWVSEAVLLGYVLRKRRKDKGLTQVELVEDLGVSPSTWSRTETGDCAATVLCLFRAASRLGVPASHLVRGVERLQIRLAGLGVYIGGKPPKRAVALTTKQLERML